MPHNDVVKLNVDDSCINGGKLGRDVIRSSNGDWFDDFTAFYDQGDILLAEFLATRDRLNICLDNGLQGVDMRVGFFGCRQTQIYDFGSTIDLHQ